MVDQTQLEPPTIDKSGRVVVHTPDGTKVAGFLGTVPERSGNGVITERDSHQHRIRALDAYAFSLTAIETMKAADVDFVLVHETDTGDTYEWKFEAVAFADEVPDQFLEHAEDPQKYVPRESARAIWRDHNPYRHDEPEQPDDADGFRRASEVN